MNVRPRKINQIVWAFIITLFICLAIGFIGIARVHADPVADTNAMVTCGIIKQDPTPNGVIASLKNLVALSYTPESGSNEFAYAINNFCPEYTQLVKYTIALNNGTVNTGPPVNVREPMHEAI